MTPWRQCWLRVITENEAGLRFELNPRGPPILLLGEEPPGDLVPLLWKLFSELVDVSKLSLSPDDARSTARHIAEREAADADGSLRTRFATIFFDGALDPVFTMGIPAIDRLQPHGFTRGGIYQLDAHHARFREAMSGAILDRLLNSGWACVVVFSTGFRETLERDLRSRGLDLDHLEDQRQILWVDWMTHRVRRVTGVEEAGATFYSGPDLTNLGIALDRASRLLSPLRPAIALLDISTTLFAVHDTGSANDFLESLKSRFRTQHVPALFLTDGSTMDRRSQARLYQWASGCLEVSGTSVSELSVAYLERGTRRRKVELNLDEGNNTGDVPEEHSEAA